MGRFGTGRYLAGAAEFLAGPASLNMTGYGLFVDDGHTAG